jgi:hypothetical protein
MAPPARFAMRNFAFRSLSEIFRQKRRTGLSSVLGLVRRRGDAHLHFHHAHREKRAAGWRLPRKVIRFPSIIAMHSERSEFMLMIVGYGWNENLPPAEASQAIDQMMAWCHGLKNQGTVTSFSPLARMGKIVSGRKGSVVLDGPFAEAKEVVGGYLVVRAGSLAEATAIAQQCPILEHGITIDVRAMVDECSIAQKLRDCLAS